MELNIPPYPIFVYGTLMAAPLLAWVLTGSAANEQNILGQRIAAQIKGFRRFSVKGADYPALVTSTENPPPQVDGYLVSPKDRAQWNKLDNFEGEVYRRVEVDAVDDKGGTRKAYTYIWNGDTEALGEEPWDFPVFEKERLEDWLMIFDGMELVG